ncbi:MAG: DUF4097 domain-containing protein [Myxococcales bacterium]|nr:DUF4097 domain-containing protein [Myxococcales bacterium]
MQTNLSILSDRTLALALAIALAAGLCTALPARSAEIDETLPVEPGGELQIELDIGAVDVESHDESEVQIEADARGGPVDFDLRQSGNEVRLTGRVRGGWLNLFRGREVRVRARVPREFSVAVTTRGGRVDVEEVDGTVEVRTTGGNIDVDQISGDLELHTTGGTIDATEIVGDTQATTTGGSIRLEEVTGDVEARTSGGEIRVQEVDGEVEADTTGGSIRVSWTAGPAGELRTTGGSIEVELPENSGVKLRARSTGGTVDIDDELQFSGRAERTEADGQLGPGGPILDLWTTGGGIRIRRR